MATCKFCGLDPVFFVQREEGGWHRPLVQVPGKLFMVQDGAMVAAPTVYRQHTCDPIAVEQHKLDKLKARYIVDPAEAEAAAYAEQDNRNRLAFYQTPEGAVVHALELQSRYERGQDALTRPCPKCRVEEKQPCVRSRNIGAHWPLGMDDYLRNTHNVR